MQIPGYGGSILHVNLTNGDVKKEPLDLELVRKFIGGAGINLRLAYDLIPADVDPLSPDNMIILGAGAFAGTIVPCSPKLMVTTKYPINGAFATSTAGGLFSLMLKSSGYDHVVISGRSDRPVYLKICDDDIELCDAVDLWGKADGWQTVDLLRRRHEPCSVIPIGPAGENLVKISTTMLDKTYHLGSGGIPAVMGSKNLKAIVAVQGTKGIKVADRLAFLKIVDELAERMRNWPKRQRYVEVGEAELCNEDRARITIEPNPVDYADFTPFSEELKSELLDRFRNFRKPIACASCPISCKTRIRLADGEYAGELAYLQSIAFQRLGADTAAGICNRSVHFNAMLDYYGLCCMNFRDVVSISTSLYKLGILTKEDTGGIEIKDDWETTLKLARMVAYREGIGDLFAEGMVEACRRIGKGAENYVVHTKGRPFFYDPRIKGEGLGTLEMNELVDPRGGMIREGFSASGWLGRPPQLFAKLGQRQGMPEEALRRIIGEDSVNLARYTRYTQDWASVFNCLGVCVLEPSQTFWKAELLANLYTALTGIETTPSELMKAGERCFNLYKVLNVRAGFGRKDDSPPEWWFKPIKDQEGKEHPLTDYYGKILTREDVEKVLDDYYDERGWDKTTSAPLPEKLKELGLEWVVLHPRHTRISHNRQAP